MPSTGNFPAVTKTSIFFDLYLIDKSMKFGKLGWFKLKIFDLIQY